MEISAHPEVTFRVGLVRASLWRKPTQTKEDQNVYWVSLDRKKETPPQRGNNEELLDGADIPAAIFALKKAHDYIKHRPGPAPQREFLSADTLIQRIP